MPLMQIKMLNFVAKIRTIKTLKYIINGIIWTLLGSYLLLVMLLNVPAVQHIIGNEVSSALSKKFGTKVVVGRVDMGIMNRIIIEDALMYDQKGKRMIQVTRLSAKFDIIPLTSGKISISSAQLFGFHCIFYKKDEMAKANYQFVLDSLASKDTTSKSNINLRINYMLIRHGNIKYDRYDVPETKFLFNTSHLDVNDLSAHIILKRLKNDSINVSIKRFSFNEASGLKIRQLSAKLKANLNYCQLSDFRLKMPQTVISADTITATYKLIDKKFIPATLQFNGEFNKTRITPCDLACFSKDLKAIKMPFILSCKFSGTSTGLNIKKLEVCTNERNFILSIDGYVSNWNGIEPKYYANVKKLLLTSEGIRYIKSNWGNKRNDIPPSLSNMGEIYFKGSVGGYGKNVITNGLLKTGVGNVKAKIGINNGRYFDAQIYTSGINIGKITGNSSFGNLAADIKAKGELHKKGIPDVKAKGSISEFEYNKYKYKNIFIDGNIKNEIFDGILSMDDPNGSININGKFKINASSPQFNMTAMVRHLNPSALHIDDQKKFSNLNVDVDANFNGKNINDIKGNIDVNNFEITLPNDKYKMQSLHIQADKKGRTRQVTLTSDFANALIEGNYDYNSLAQSVTNFIGKSLPSIPGLPKTNNKHNNNFKINATITRSDWMNKLFDIPLQLNEPLTLNGYVDDNDKKIDISANIPNFDYKGSRYERCTFTCNNPNDTLCGQFEVRKLMSNKEHYDISVDAKAINNKLRTTLKWYNQKNRHFYGNVVSQSQFYLNDKNLPTAKVDFEPSEIIVNDTVWNVKPSTVEYYKNHISVNDFTIEHGKQHLIINGVASKNQDDSLIVDLHDVNVEYILGIVNFHTVEFSGLASGNIYLSSLFSSPLAYAKLKVKQFEFENGHLGVLTASVLWNNENKQININANTVDEHNGKTYIMGHVSPVHDVIDLSIIPNNANIEFMHSFVGSFMDNIEGRTTGNLRLSGQLSGNINLTGLITVNGSVRIKSLNTTYKLRNDTIRLIPDEIEFQHTPIYDRYNNIGYIDGRVHHKHLTQLSYDLSVSANKLLCYDIHDFGDSNFYGTVYGTGNVDIHGKSGEVNIDINVTPDRNTTFVYNAANPDAITTQQFISWNDKSRKLPEKTDSTDIVKESDENYDIPTDIHLNFLINCTQDATLKVIMDAKTNDYITLNGNGVIRASYFNKGAFNMFGTYLVDHGIYKLTIQNIIKKDFTFKQGGTIIFGGDPYNAALNLQAVYTVSGVSLSDLSIGNSFSQNTIHVNCIMNISGDPKEPKVNFDLDLPSVNSEEKQMVKSIINSEEDMNQQVIYLLGIGRFYTQGANANNSATGTQESQTTLAMQSFLSGTISSQLNSMLSSFINSNKWNFGANITTGNEGWNNAEYEGILSGRLLNNRLLINGQFGYRDKANATTNFVGDFDIQYLLTPNGNFSIRGYNQTNDRYFTKSSLNTQGVGFVIKKDFNGLRDLFNFRKRKTK